MTTFKRISCSLAPAILIALTILLGGCGGSDSTTGSSVTTAGIGLPTEISAVSTGTSAGTLSLAGSIRTLATSAANLPADSDYRTTPVARYVDEPTLEVFGIIETILNSMAQTHYADPANVGSGPYKSMVAWYDEQDGKTTKDLEEWIVDSRLTTENGQPVNLVHVWVVSDTDPVEVEVKIYQAPSQASDGSYLDYGKWSINALMTGQTPPGRFYADADVIGGETVLRLSENMAQSDTFAGPSGSNTITLTAMTRAIMHKSSSSGYGKAEISDWSYCWNYDPGTQDSPCYDGSGSFTLPAPPVTYAYDANTLALQMTDSSNSTVTRYKDRGNPVEIAYRYGVFDGTTGADIEATSNFGFPVTYTGSGNTQQYGFYGAWQGRHQLWSPQGLIPDGTVVTKEDYSGQTSGTSYTTKTFYGTLTKRLLTTADISQLAGIPVEIWVGDSFDLVYDAANSRWNKCLWDPTANGGVGGESCSDFTQGLVTLISDPNGRKQVDINFWDMNSNSNMMLMYNGSGFYQKDQAGNMGQAFTPADKDRLNVWMGGSTYIEYTGNFAGGASGWEEKDLVSFDQQTWTPTFAANNLGPFDFPVDREYYVNNKGVNFVVTRTAVTGSAGDYQVQMEQQLVVTPDNAATLLTGIDYFAFPWDDPASRSTYSFDTATMELQNTSDNSLVNQGQWGLMAYSANGTPNDPSDDVAQNIQFNWEYTDPNSGQGWGAVTYLVDSNGNYVYLDDPLRFDPVSLNVNGMPINFSLEYDGWMHGLPDMRWELEKNGFELTPELAGKIVNLPAGTELTIGSANYFVKPTEIGVILPTISAPANPPDLTAATALDLAGLTLPAAPSIGSQPTGLTVRYVEGEMVQ
ncbi:hypothetical protein [Geothermobacter hydrogeniphilus]|uniref:Uncharacterized protein n=1 Tax=Geothermobacter hydrogeniphilus TaxID=1969733 RepID=A0A1X0YCX2_9BACT|nr:hypothetical protein [Geothermobacter hydrogeniphilus]ORJ62952.1 hypothetical protein B5V00_02565 [Geothermobacter hydrogeniphilus]